MAFGEFTDKQYYYDDLFGNALQLYSPVWGSAYVEENHDDITLDFHANGDVDDETKRVDSIYQIMHKAVFGADSFFQLHFHHLQKDATKRTITAKYRILKHGTDPSNWVTQTVNTNDGSDAYVYSSGTLVNYTWLPEIDISDLGVSDIIQFHIARTDGNSGDLQVTYFDAHIRVDGLGSRTIFAK